MNKINNDIIRKFILSEFLCFLPMLLGIILYSKLPGQIAIHFDNNNEPNNYAPKGFAVFAIPVIIILLQAFVLWRYHLDDEKQKIGKKLNDIIIFSLPVIFLMVMVITYMYALGYGINISLICMTMSGLFLFIAGNYIPKCHYIGFHLPWVSDEEAVWHKTYRFTGWVFMLDGVLMIVFAVLNTPNSLWVILWMVFIFTPFLLLLLFSLTQSKK